MNIRHTLPIALAVLAGTGLGPTGRASAEPSAETLRQANAVFVGTVAKKGESRVASVPASDKTVVVTVERVITTPPGVSLAPNDEVTVVAKDPGSLHEGDRATFYAQGAVIGDSVAVNELDHAPAPAPEAARAERGDATAEKLADAKLRERIEKADAIVVGRVTAVRPMAASARTERGRGRISEHDPKWQSAVIHVESAIRGASPKEALVVRFPASDDVAFKNAPKLREGQSGTFLLRKDQITGHRTERVGGQEVSTYTALGSADVLSPTEEGRVRTLVGQ